MQFTLFYIHFTSARFLSSTFGSLFNFKNHKQFYEKTHRSRIFLLCFLASQF